MPVEITELIMRATVNGNATAPDGGAKAKDHLRSDGVSVGGLSPGELDRVVDACVGRVLQILNESQRRGAT